MELSKSLFWDIDMNDLDYEKHGAFIVERVLCRGTLKDFKNIIKFYGKQKVNEWAKSLRYLDERVLNFCSVYFETPETSYRCYITRQSNQTHWNY